MKFHQADQAWHYALDKIAANGSDVITENRQRTREVLNLFLEITNPLAGYPITGSGWDLPALEEYATSLCNFSYDLKGFDYTYSERMGRQIHYLTEMLRKYPTSRRATAFLWLPEKDLETGLHHPCQIMADYKLRDGKLHAAHVFRSHDIKDAWPQNVYGLAKLQESIADSLEVQAGSLSTLSISAHYYIERKKIQ